MALTFPFCIVMSRRSDVTLPLVPSPGYVAAFSSVERAAAFMFKRGETNWKMTLVSRPTLDGLVRDLKLLGVRGFCFDPVGDGCGELVEFDGLGEKGIGGSGEM